MGKIGNFRKKKNIVFVSCAAVLVLVGGTISYHSSRGFFTNLFHLGYWQNETVEDFTGPDNWSICEEVPKTVIGRNTGNMPAIARLKYEEYWKAAGSTSTDHTSELSLVDGDNDPIATVNLQNEVDWVDGGDGWYYYRYILQPGDETTSLLKSVTLNCKNNFAGENSVCTTEGNTTSCTKPDNPYDGAKYHVFVTVQYIEEDGCQDIWGHCAESKHVVDCNGNILYDAIACQTNGIDSGVDFSSIATVDTGNGNGVNTHSVEANYQYPVYYYRGEVNNNYVAWGGLCWSIIRTTTTGGVKMIYDGRIRGGTCPQRLNVSEYVKFNDSQNVVGPASVGYMYGESYQPYSLSDLSPWCYNGSLCYWANDVTWDENTHQYILVDYIDSSVADFTYKRNMNHHYTCLPPDGVGILRTSCESVYYLSDATQSSTFVIKLSNGENIEDAKEKMFANNSDSAIKTAVENWFEENLVEYEEDLEDTIFCNDRSISYGLLKSKDNIGTSNYQYAFPNSIGPWNLYTVFSANKRVGVLENNYSPDLRCANKNDSFTKSDVVNGNGKLKYKVGLATADEYTLAGMINKNIDNNTNYLYTSKSSWLMSPYRYDNTYGIAFIYVLGDLSESSLTSTNQYRPVVSLKAGTTFVAGGDGTSANPYVVEQQ